MCCYRFPFQLHQDPESLRGPTGQSITPSVAGRVSWKGRTTPGESSSNGSSEPDARATIRTNEILWLTVPHVCPRGGETETENQRKINNWIVLFATSEPRTSSQTFIFFRNHSWNAILVCKIFEHSKFDEKGKLYADSWTVVREH